MRRQQVNYDIKKDKTWLVREEERVYEARSQGVFGRKRKRFRLIDVFAGAGGMTLGFSKMFSTRSILSGPTILTIPVYVRIAGTSEITVY